jgi:hypothetical protein
MNSLANTRRRLAPCTSVGQCAHPDENSSMATLDRIPKTPDRTSPRHRLTVVHPQQRKTGSQNFSLQVQMLFKIHNPI